MKVLVACEFSGIVRDAFIAKGHDAVSCDLLTSERPGPHIWADNDMHLKDILYRKKFDLVIGHPPCTRLTNSVIWYIEKNNLQDEVYQAACFFNMILNCPAKMVCVENPIMNKYARLHIRKHDQIIQPYMFGHDAKKSTCLWLKNLPPLVATDIIAKKRYANQTPSGQNNILPGPDRWKERSRTFQGIADAMANQWGGL